MRVLDLVRRLVGRHPDDAVIGRRTAATFSVELSPSTTAGPSYPDEARFDLFLDGDRAGYALRPDQMKEQVVERLDIEMRRMGGHGPEPRRSIEESIAESRRLQATSRPGGRFCCLRQADEDDRTLIRSRFERMLAAIESWPLFEMDEEVVYQRPSGCDEAHPMVTSYFDDGQSALQFGHSNHGVAIRIVGIDRRDDGTRLEARRASDAAWLREVILHLDRPFGTNADGAVREEWRSAVEQARTMCMAIITSVGQEPIDATIKLPSPSTGFAVGYDGDDIEYGLLEAAMNEAVGIHAPSTIMIEQDRTSATIDYLIQDGNDLKDDRLSDELELTTDQSTWPNPIETMRIVTALGHVPRPWTILSKERDEP